jgi:hypothetical protein
MAASLLTGPTSPAGSDGEDHKVLIYRVPQCTYVVYFV